MINNLVQRFSKHERLWPGSSHPERATADEPSECDKADSSFDVHTCLSELPLPTFILQVPESGGFWEL